MLIFTSELVTGTGVISAPLRHMKPAAHWALPVKFLTALKLVMVVVSKNAQIPPQIWALAADKAVAGVVETLNILAVGAAVMAVLETVWDG